MLASPRSYRIWKFQWNPQTLHPKSIIGTTPNTNYNLRYSASIFKVYKSIIGPICPNTKTTCAIQRPSLNPIPKVLLVPFPTPMITYAIPAPVFQSHFQKVILVPVPTPIKLTLSSALLETPFQKYYWYIPNINNNLRCPSAHLKSYLQNYYWCHSKYQ